MAAEYGLRHALARGLRESRCSEKQGGHEPESPQPRLD
jgi:hypothetical protein